MKAPTDFNDVAKLHGTEAVARAIAGASVVAKVERPRIDNPPPTDFIVWSEPQPLIAKMEPEPYPIDALPPNIRSAVEEVASFVKAPVSLIASSALAAVSLATQAHIDVKRADRLQGPSGLFLLTIADSGERKSTCDGFFTSSIRQYQEEQKEAMKPELMRYESDLAAWTAERDGLLSAIKDAGKKGNSTDEKRTKLTDLRQRKPKRPKVPTFLLGDETPENLGWRLATEWPSAGVISAEAAIVLGAHGMGKESAMRNMGLLNILWDGGSHTVGRRTSEDYTVKGARLTIALQIQEPTLRGFFEQSGGLARGTGFLARFLVAWPQSTQGSRPFTEAPQAWPRLAAFNRRIADILAIPIPIDDNGSLSLAPMTLAPEAKEAWIAYHDAIEAELSCGGELFDVRDVASKSADNAARLAGLFAVLEHGLGDTIELDCFAGASRIAAWHLRESLRFFNELVLPADLADASRLDAWLIDHCHRKQVSEVAKNHVRQHGPLRDKVRLDAAIRELAGLERVRLTKDGKRSIIRVNPALIQVLS